MQILFISDVEVDTNDINKGGIVLDLNDPVEASNSLNVVELHDSDIDTVTVIQSAAV